MVLDGSLITKSMIASSPITLTAVLRDTNNVGDAVGELEDYLPIYITIEACTNEQPQISTSIPAETSLIIAEGEKTYTITLTDENEYDILSF